MLHESMCELSCVAGEALVADMWRNVSGGGNEMILIVDNAAWHIGMNGVKASFR